MCHVSPPCLVQLLVSEQLSSSRPEFRFLLCGRTPWWQRKSPLQVFSLQLSWRPFSFLQMFLFTSQLETQKRPEQVRQSSHISASIPLSQRTVPWKKCCFPANICPEILCYSNFNIVLTHWWTSHWAEGVCKEEKRGREASLSSTLLVQVYDFVEKVLQDLIQRDLG